MKDELFEKFFTDRLTDREVGELTRQLASGDAARAAFADYVLERRALVRVAERLATAESRQAAPRRPPCIGMRRILALAACLVVAVGLFGVVRRRHAARSPYVRLSPSQWRADGPLTTLAASPTEKGRLRIRAEGLLTLRDAAGATLLLTEATDVSLPRAGTEPPHLVLNRGHIHAQIAPRPTPFVLASAAADVVVSGTEFTASVEETRAAGKQPEAAAPTKTLRVVLFDGALQLTNAAGRLALLPGEVGTAEEGSAPVKAVSELVKRFGQHYVPVPVDVRPAIPQYPLPLARNTVGNYYYVFDRIDADSAFWARLVEHGFAGMRWVGDDFVGVYSQLRRSKQVPVYVTSDSVLHLYHIQFDETLRILEQRQFIPYLTALSKKMVEHLGRKVRPAAATDRQRAAADKALAFCAVGYEALTDYSEEAAALRVFRDELAKERNWTSWQARRLVARRSEPDQHAITSLPGWDPQDGATALAAVDKGIAAYTNREEPALPPHVRHWVDQALDAMAKHEGFAATPIFEYDEDFSQYVPRGHYTRGYDLKRYFRAMMWFGRMSFLLKGGDPHGPGHPYLVSAEEAHRQTMAACMLTRALRDLYIDDVRAAAVWERIYHVTSFFVGLADDLSYTEYDRAFTQVLGPNYTAADLEDDTNYFNVKLALARLRSPAIYSGTGAQVTPDALSGAHAPEELDRVLAKTHGFRLMGQRFVPDSYVMGKLIYPNVGNYRGERPAGKVLTAVETPWGTVRGFPRGLDVMYLLGSQRAAQILTETEDNAYRGYDRAFADLKKEFAQIVEPGGWNINLYWSWLYALKGMLAPYPRGYQTYMTGTAWQDKQLNAALGSWSQLRHDTILYVKQSYTAHKLAAPRLGRRRPEDFPGYVEPVPTLYARLLALCRLTEKTLTAQRLLDKATGRRLANTDELLARLLHIAEKELANQPLNKDDENWIKHFDGALKNACAGHKADAMKTTLIADVHTDQNSRQVLQEGTGRIRLIVVANRLPDGNIGLAVGPVFSYYEFRHPMQDRLTDERWREMLYKSDDQLEANRPAFAQTY